ncbi:MAG: hypothetical protein QG640_240 [Patescibacteria group bacterium]|nr:hypothetical protein [Patescibacteria group bacterium]
MDNIGGAEVVTLTLARELGADVYTTNIDEEKIKKMGFADVIPRINSIGKIPVRAPFRHQLAFWKFRRLNLGKKYEFYIISGDWAMSGAVNNKPNLWYVHSPLNELWQFKDYIKKELVVWWKRPIFETWVQFNRMLTLRYAKHVGVWVCNSKNTQQRIEKFYKQNAEIAHPPIETKKFRSEESKGYWLSVNRIVAHKRIEIQTEAFSKLPEEKLVVVGSYEQGAEQFENYKHTVEKGMTSNVKMIHWADSEELQSLYSGCKGFIVTSKDEDFGMTAVEAMASGKPVIAPNEGGYMETIIDGKTGVLINAINGEKLTSAIKELSSKLHDPENQKTFERNCLARAKEFDTSIFIKKIVSLLRPSQTQE